MFKLLIISKPCLPGTSTFHLRARAPSRDDGSCQFHMTLPKRLQARAAVDLSPVGVY
jgi:hypothetical protein